MSKVSSPKTDFRIVVTPRGLGDFGGVRMSDTFVHGHGKDGAAAIAREYQSRCEEIAKEIKRHVDCVDSVSIEFDQQHVCEHCGWAWSEDSDTYNGGCCDKDEEAHLQATGGQQ